ncbi:protein trichome birefringence-like 23 [Impatiens glandulifera]|uniref:protein trichome birefringence-like 23 n=1 Tax=Impatiens glandulifera TaxID=253017 RepID=UPI001FB160D4|nr:protein trichome birefringence-like 23 [Impatiens glandulifera]
MVQRTKPKWEKLWGSFQRRDYILAKLIVFLILIGLAFKIMYLDSTGFTDGETIPFINQTVNLNPLVSGDLSENGQSTNNTQPSNQISPQIWTDLDETTKRISVNGSLLEPSADSPGDLSKDGQSSANRISVNGSLADSPENPPSVTVDLTDQKPNKEKCDIFSGDWIPNPSGPLYTYETCHLITSHQDCIKNGRPDTGFLYWKWRPRDCDLPSFDAKKFLELMKNKTWALIGDSLSRNHVESLLCILSQVDPAIEVYHDEEWRSKRWQFASYNFTISVIWSPFLAKASIFEDYNGVSSAPIQLHLDKLDQTWTDLYPSLDYMIFSSGEWFSKSAIYYENNTILGGHSLPNEKNYTNIAFNLAYRKILKNLFNFILESNHNGTIFYRTTTTDHFENGEWYNGGSCQRTEPVKEGELKITQLTEILRVVEIDEFEKAQRKGFEKGMKLRLLDVMSQSSLRPDGHPGLYRHAHPLSSNNTKYYDCLHWCLPGPIDSWNDLIMEMIVNGLK